MLVHIGVGKRKAFAGQQSVPFEVIAGQRLHDTFNRCFYRVIRVQVSRGIFLIRRSLSLSADLLAARTVSRRASSRHRCCGIFWLVSFASFHGFVIVSRYQLAVYPQFYAAFRHGTHRHDESSQPHLIAHRFQEPDIVPQCVDCFVDIAIAGSKGMDAIKIPKAKSAFP